MTYIVNSGYCQYMCQVAPVLTKQSDEGSEYYKYYFRWSRIASSEQQQALRVDLPGAEDGRRTNWRPRLNFGTLFSRTLAFISSILLL
jgi:hypothetical protein